MPDTLTATLLTGCLNIQTSTSSNISRLYSRRVYIHTVPHLQCATYKTYHAPSMRTTLARLACSVSKPSSPAPAASKPPTSRLRTPPLSLDHFIQRSRVLHLYRDIVRSLYRYMQPPQRDESVAYAKGEFLRNRDVREIERIRYLISTGKAEWDGVRRGVEGMGLKSGKQRG